MTTTMEESWLADLRDTTPTPVVDIHPPAPAGDETEQETRARHMAGFMIALGGVLADKAAYADWAVQQDPIEQQFQSPMETTWAYLRTILPETIFPTAETEAIE